MQSSEFTGKLVGRPGEKAEVERDRKFWLSESMAESTIYRDGRVGGKSGKFRLSREFSTAVSGKHRIWELNNPYVHPPCLSHPPGQAV